MDHPVAISPKKRTSTSGNSGGNSKKALSSASSIHSSPVTTSSSSPAGFNFISVDPSSQTESSSSRTLIRANAGRYIWKRRKASTSKERNGRAKPYERPSLKRNAPTVKTDPNSAVEDLPRVKEENEDEEQAVTVHTGPRRRMARRFDPTSGLNHGLRSPLFTSFGTEVPEDIVRRTFQYC